MPFSSPIYPSFSLISPVFSAILTPLALLYLLFFPYPETFPVHFPMYFVLSLPFLLPFTLYFLYLFPYLLLPIDPAPYLLLYGPTSVFCVCLSSSYLPLAFPPSSSYLIYFPFLIPCFLSSLSTPVSPLAFPPIYITFLSYSLFFLPTVILFFPPAAFPPSPTHSPCALLPTILLSLPPACSPTCLPSCPSSCLFVLVSVVTQSSLPCQSASHIEQSRATYIIFRCETLMV